MSKNYQEMDNVIAEPEKDHDGKCQSNKKMYDTYFEIIQAFGTSKAHCH